MHENFYLKNYQIWFGSGSGIGTETFPKSEPEPEEILVSVPQHCLQRRCSKPRYGCLSLFLVLLFPVVLNIVISFLSSDGEDCDEDPEEEMEMDETVAPPQELQLSQFSATFFETVSIQLLG